jgi:hypothetical protein
MKSTRAHSGTQNCLVPFGLGLATGALVGVGLQRRLTAPRRMPLLDIWQPAMTQMRGELAAALLAQRVQERYDELFSHRPHFASRALRMHLETGILPCLALYQVLRQEHGTTESAMDELDRLFNAWAERSGKRKLLRQMARLPNPFALLRLGNRFTLRRDFPLTGAGWRMTWVEDSDQRVAYTITECFYVKMLASYGAPELTRHICRMDDLIFSGLRGFRWERTKTLGRGDDCCDFCFSRTGETKTSQVWETCEV